MKERSDLEVLSELSKSSKAVEPFDDFIDDPEQAAVDALYRQAVRVAEEYGWPAPSPAEFEARDKEEMARKTE